MCLAIPMKLVERTGAEGLAEVSGIRRRVLLDLVPEAALGDYLIVHAGYAIQRLDEEAAAEILETLESCLALAEEAAPEEPA